MAEGNQEHPAWFHAAKVLARKQGIRSSLINATTSRSTADGVDLCDHAGQLLLHCSWQQLSNTGAPPEVQSAQRRVAAADAAACGLLPISVVIALLLQAIPITRFLLRGLMIWFHEFGHAVVAWFSGRQALPLPLGWMVYNPDRSVVVMLLLLSLEGVLLVMGVRSKHRMFTSFAATLIAFQLLGWFWLPHATFEVLMSWSGIAGEFILPTVLIVLSLYPLPDYFKWSFYRYPVQLASCYGLVHSLMFWRDVSSGRVGVPYGSIWNPDHGDMNDLVHIGWSESDIIRSYDSLGWCCVLCIGAVACYRLLQWRRALELKQSG